MAIMRDTPSKLRLWDLLRTPGKRRQRIVCASLGLLFTLCLILACAGVFSKNRVAPVVDSSTGNVGADGTDNGGINGTDNGGINTGTDETNPTASPTAAVVTTGDPTAAPTLPPTPPVTYRPGELVVRENGMILSKGLKSRQLAKTGEKVTYHNGQQSELKFHIRPDGAAVFRVPDELGKNKGGWVYVSNSEGLEAGSGGVNALWFDKDGRVVGYYNLLNGTIMNCSGGKTPWNTWVSCEEWEFTGQVYQVDPFNRRPPEKTTIGIMEGGRYEAFAYDDRNKTHPVFYVTEDQRNGPTRRFRPDPSIVDWKNNSWEMLHGEGKLDFLFLEPDANNDNKTGTYKWVESIHEARANAYVTYPSAEGIDRHHSMLYMSCKREKMLYILDLDSNKYVRYGLEIALFDGEPDQVTRIIGDDSETMYFNEDLGNTSGVHSRNKQGQLSTILEGPGWSNEVTGVAFCPTGHRMYLCFQEEGVMFEITREDGYPFQAKTLNVRYHNKPVESLWSRRRSLRVPIN
jgi:hypothetical protein